MAERNELSTPHRVVPASVASPFAAPADIPRSLRLTFEDDLLLPRYTDPLPIQPEPESQSLQARRARILAATATPTPLCDAVSPGFPPPQSPQQQPQPQQLTPNVSPQLLPQSPQMLATSPGAAPLLLAGASFMQQPLQQSAVGRPRGMSSARLQPPLFVAKAAAEAQQSQQRAPSQLRESDTSSAQQQATASLTTPGSARNPPQQATSAGSGSSGVSGGSRPLHGGHTSPHHANARVRRTQSAAFVTPAPLISPLPVRPEPSRLQPQPQQSATLLQQLLPPLDRDLSTNSSQLSSPDQASSASSAPTSPTALALDANQQKQPPPPLWSPKRTRSCSPKEKPVSGGQDWNTQFAEAIEGIGALTHNSHADERIRAYERLSLLAADFNNTVRTYGKIIISEVYLPKEQKTIKPIEIGGIAGGDKYIVQRILFKFAVDSKGQFSGDEFASKVAGHELKSLVHIYMCWERGVHFPMMTLVDYRGFRIVGMPLLPINGTETLVHGSHDAGRTIRTCAYLEERLKSIGEKLNLKQHLVGLDGKPFWTPIDLEGHLGFDGKYYLVDFSRLFPPQALTTGHKLGNLYQLLRPEFVRNYEVPLCSDAFSKFTCPDHPESARRDMAEQHNVEVDSATAYLKDTVIPTFAKQLVELSKEQREEFPLVMRLHEQGINVRFTGLIYTHVCKISQDEYWPVKLFIEMAARTIKSEVNALLRKKMRELRHPGESQYRAAVVTHFNVVFGSSPASQRHWTNYLLPALTYKFPGFETQLSANRLRSWLSETAHRAGLGDGRCLLFRAAAQKLGLHFASTTWHEMTENPVAFERYTPFNDTDLKEMRERVKEMNVAAHATAFMLKTKAMLMPNPEERDRLLQLAYHQFARALEANPDNKVSLRNIADCLVLLGHFERATDMYIRALQSDPEDTNTLYKFAIALDKTGHLDEAEEYYVRALEACPQHSNCCLCYADFLWHLRKNLDEAEHFYTKALEVDTANYAACNNYACFLVTARHNFDHAEKLFKSCILAETRNQIIVNNYASFLLHIRRSPADARAVLQSHKTHQRT